MADAPEAGKAPPPTVEPTVLDMSRAPVVYFESSPAFAHLNGVIAITLATSLVVPMQDGSATNLNIAAAHLRCNIPAAMHLRKALDEALLLATETQGGAH